MIRLGLIALISLSLSPQPSAAIEPVPPEEFRAMAEGWTVYFTLNGALYGAESYGKGDRSCWCYIEGECQEGVWWADGPQLCFDYGHEGSPSCWTLHRDDGGIVARLEGDRPNAGMELRFLRQDRQPLACAFDAPMS